MISILEYLDQSHIDKSKRELQEKFDKGLPGGVDIRGSEIRAETARKIQPRISKLEAERDAYKNVAGKVTKNEETPGFFSKAAKAAGDVAPYAAVAGVGAYGIKKYLDKRKQQTQPTQQANYPV